jgi:hypothetical protein
MNIQDYFREHQMIRFATVISLMVAVFIVASFAIVLMAHGQNDSSSRVLISESKLSNGTMSVTGISLS